MLASWLQHLRLSIQARTGLGTAAIVLVMVAVLALFAVAVLLLVAAYVWLALRHGEITAALVLAGIMFLLAIAALAVSLVLQRRARTRAALALVAEHRAPWLEPATWGVALQVGRAIGLRRIAPLAAAGVLAALLAREWSRGHADDAGPR